MLQVHQEDSLKIIDKKSFDHPPIESHEDWELLLKQYAIKAERFASQIEFLTQEELHQIFVNPKYGNYYRNLHRIIEHAHYHLGQIVLLKKNTSTDLILR